MQYQIGVVQYILPYHPHRRTLYFELITDTGIGAGQRVLHMVKIHKNWTAMGVGRIALLPAVTPTPSHVRYQLGTRTGLGYQSLKIRHSGVHVVVTIKINGWHLTLLLQNHIIPSALSDFGLGCRIIDMVGQGHPAGRLGIHNQGFARRSRERLHQLR